MTLKKKLRVKDKALLSSFHDKPCLVCGRGPSDPHHLKTRGAGGDDSDDNLIALCRVHHVEIHKIGRDTFIQKYNIKLSKDN